MEMLEQTEKKKQAMVKSLSKQAYQSLGKRKNHSPEKRINNQDFRNTDNRLGVHVKHCTTLCN